MSRTAGNRPPPSRGKGWKTSPQGHRIHPAGAKRAPDGDTLCPTCGNIVRPTSPSQNTHIFRCLGCGGTAKNDSGEHGEPPDIKCGRLCPSSERPDDLHLRWEVCMFCAHCSGYVRTGFLSFPVEKFSQTTGIPEEIVMSVSHLNVKEMKHLREFLDFLIFTWTKEPPPGAETTEAE